MASVMEANELKKLEGIRDSVCESEGKHEHLRDLYYRQFREFTPLTDAEIDRVIVTYYACGWQDLLIRMEWVNKQKCEASVICQLDQVAAA